MIGELLCNYRGYDIYNIGNTYIIEQFQFKWAIIQDAFNHIDRHLIYKGEPGPYVPTYIHKQDDIEVFEIKTPDIKIIEPNLTVEIKDIYNKIKIDIINNKLKDVIDGLLTLIRECYSKDIIDNEFVETIKDRLDRLEKVIGYTSSDNSNESKIAEDKSLRICNEILININKQAKIEDEMTCQKN